MRTMFAVLAGLIVLSLAGCGSSSPATPAPGTLAKSYFNTFTADEKANLAAQGTPDQFLGSLLGAYQCADAPSGHAGCPPDDAVAATGRRLGGSLFERSVVVKRHSGRFDVVPLYLAIRSDGTTDVIDGAGRAYARGLADFRAHNDQFGTDDMLLLAKPFTNTQGGFRLQVLTGRTRGGAALWPYVLIGALVLAGVLGTATLFIARRRT